LDISRTLEATFAALVGIGYLPAVLAPYYLALAALRALEFGILMGKPTA
jgi:hypothetical protein